MERERISSEYFKDYRRRLGFTRQDEVKAFFGAKDIVPAIDLEYVASLNDRLFGIVQRLNTVVADGVRCSDEEAFRNSYIDNAFRLIVDNGILERLNNQGRRQEEVYFSWMRGYVTVNYFKEPIASMFGVDAASIRTIGDDDLANVETFRRTPTADLELPPLNGRRVRLEVQSGFQGVNDIKQHKVHEAQRAFQRENIITLVMHFDIFNGQAGIIRIDNIDDKDVNWITRQQMEGQTVLNIDQNNFIWKLTDPAPPRDIVVEIING
jgi:hypothetical protein